MTGAQAARAYASVLRDARRASLALAASSIVLVTALLADLARTIAELSDDDMPPTESRQRELEPP